MQRLTATVVQVQRSCFPPSWPMFHMWNMVHAYVYTSDVDTVIYSHKNKYVLIKPVNTQQVVLYNTFAVWNVAAYLKHTLKKCQLLNFVFLFGCNLIRTHLFWNHSTTFCRGGFGSRGGAGHLVIRRSVVWSPAASDCYRSSLEHFAEPGVAPDAVSGSWMLDRKHSWDRNPRCRQTLSDICITHVMKQRLYPRYIWTIT